ncbi:maleylpyruvate isomerase N-terminal domain-containing protein [Streptomyces sp. SID7909]|uniref:maleylpyruvate isomerase N-terminal domain-containing protein n=1 Tax=Streptomyces sp. SID7909 TaxID=2706092 RepID=UPI0013BAE2C2|nr:maleylpyruvate isomerase N-terminal domain-containing protein [Streptomyces sp. SID7909]NEC10438.1 maleylpyruvate isomerase family protein [Streptomyces sp. SID7909]
MGTVTEHERTRAALAGAGSRLGELLRAVSDPDAASGVPEWTVGDVGTHLAAVYLAYTSLVSGDGAMDWGDIPPPGEGTFAERITAINERSVTVFERERRAQVPEFIAEQCETFLRVTEGMAPDTPVAPPWYDEMPFTLATLTGLMLSETLVHGLDVARGARLTWPIGDEEARLVLGQSMPTMMTAALDPVKAKGVRIAFDLAIKDGPSLAVVVDDGTVTVTRDAPPRAYDCRIVAAPATFLLVSFRRTPIWKAVATGRMRAGGRKPWLAVRLGQLVVSP